MRMRLFNITLFFLCCLLTRVQAQNELAFTHLTVEDGLSHGSVLSVTQDANGFIWVGTMDGLNRFDGKRVKVYRSFYNDNPLAASIKITRLVADQNFNVWVGTNNGLYLYNSKLDSFRVFYNNTNNAGSISNNNIRALYKDKAGNIWVGTENGLNLVKKNNGSGISFEHIKLNTGKAKAISNNIQSIYQDDEQNIWVGTDRGVACIGSTITDNYKKLIELFSGTNITSIAKDLDNNFWIGTHNSGIYKVNTRYYNVRSYRSENDKGAALTSNIIRKIIVDKEGRVWIGTLKGLNIYDPRKHLFEKYLHKPGEYNSLNYNSIHDMVEDTQGNVWVGTYFGGVNIVEAAATKFEIYKNEDSKNNISSNVISSIVEDSKNNLWIGTEAEGLMYFNRKLKKIYTYKNDLRNTTSISSNLVKIILKDKKNNIWVGLHNGMLEKIIDNGKAFEHFKIGEEQTELDSEDITSLAEDDLGNIWIGKVQQGLYIFNKELHQVKKFEELFGNQKLSSNAITFLFQDSRRNLWIGTKKGVNVLEGPENSLKRIYKEEYQNGLQSDYVNCIAEDRKGNILLGTNAGISIYNPYTRKLDKLDVFNALTGNKIFGIILDDDNNLWVSTNNGITRIDSTRTVLNTYNKIDGLPGDVFNYNSFCKDSKGHIFFGGYNGFVEFNPKQIQLNQAAPRLLLTSLFVNGQQVTARDSTKILFQDISATQNIELAYNQNIISINWSVLNFIKPGKNRSVYKLVGYDKDWMPSQNSSATFTNLPPGRYTLFIKGCNNDGYWSDALPYLTIVVSPPFWKTWWAYASYLIIFLLIAVSVFHFFNSREDLKRKLQYEHAINLQQKELHQMKMDFFTHISHEIRTPLTLIVGPTEMLLEQSLPVSVTKKMLTSVKSNAERLLKLTNDLLAFRKADSGYLQLKIECRDIVTFCKSVFEKFAGEALHKNIQYELITAEEELPVYFDAEHMEIVFSNLLSNALKFTAGGGKVSMQILRMGQEVQICVTDNGEGIPEEDHSKIFTGFYQVKRDDNRKMGSGIGLAFTKTLIELHKGTINFTSLKNTVTNTFETCFIVSLKLGQNHFDTNNTIVA